MSTRCKRGHDLTADDAWYVRPDGMKRMCRKCRDLRDQRRHKGTVVLDGITITPDQPLCAQRPDAWFADDPFVQERAVVTCMACPMLLACRRCVDDLESQVGMQDGVWAAEKPGSRMRRRGSADPALYCACGTKLSWHTRASGWSECSACRERRVDDGEWMRVRIPMDQAGRTL